MKFEGAGDNKGLCCSAENGGGEWSALKTPGVFGGFFAGEIVKLSLS